ncbi:MAG: hypothetical protein EOO62_19645 [Hymenobacter sp.]|nr:MAG: hypothetical protein EOO62_19645 [Hymenobacter sp.]
MASPTHSFSPQRTAASHPYRRSSFNGARQLKAAQKPKQLALLVVGALMLALLVAVGTIAFHLLGAQ